MVALHIRQHAELLELAEDILKLAATGNAGRSRELAELRLTFARAVNKHCAEEGTTICEAVAQGILCRDVVAELNRELMFWRAELASCNSTWPGDRVFENKRGFTLRFGALVKTLRQHIARKNSDILSVIARGSSQSAVGL